MRQFFKDMWDVLRGRGAEAKPVSPCAGKRHLYLGAEFCRRGCGKKNRRYKPEPVAVPTEG